MVKSFYSPEILTFIDANSKFYQPITPDKFVIAGEYFADLAQVLNHTSDRWLRNWLNDSYGENEYCEVTHDWSDWLGSKTQQSVSVAFLAKYLPSSKSNNDYPEERKSWSKAVLDLVQPSKIPISFAKLITLSQILLAKVIRRRFKRSAKLLNSKLKLCKHEES